MNPRYLVERVVVGVERTVIGHRLWQGSDLVYAGVGWPSGATEMPVESSWASPEDHDRYWHGEPMPIGGLAMPIGGRSVSLSTDRSFLQAFGPSTGILDPVKLTVAMTARGLAIDSGHRVTYVIDCDRPPRDEPGDHDPDIVIGSDVISLFGWLTARCNLVDIVAHLELDGDAFLLAAAAGALRSPLGWAVPDGLADLALVAATLVESHRGAWQEGHRGAFAAV